MILDDAPEPVAVPLAPEARWVERLLWLFMLSFALDYRAAVDREATSGTGWDQLVLLGLCGVAVASMKT